MIPVADDMLVWRQRARSLRQSAADMADPRHRDGVLAIADSYERMATMAEARIARRAAKIGFFWRRTVYLCLVAGSATVAVALMIHPIGWRSMLIALT